MDGVSHEYIPADLADRTRADYADQFALISENLRAFKSAASAGKYFCCHEPLTTLISNSSPD